MSSPSAGAGHSSTSGNLAERATLALSRMPHAQQMGVCLGACTEDLGVVLRLPFQQRLIGNMQLPAIHGGVIGSFMQITALVAAFTQLGERRPPRFIDFSIDYLSHAVPEDLLARCSFQRIGRRVAAVSISCWQSDENTPVAVARAHLFAAAVNAAQRAVPAAGQAAIPCPVGRRPG